MTRRGNSSIFPIARSVVPYKYIDIFVENQLIVKLKSVEKTLDIHEAQMLFWA